MCSEPYLVTKSFLITEQAFTGIAVSSNKVLPYHRTGIYRHSHHYGMEVWMMPQFGKDESINFFFKQNGPVSQFLSVWQNFSTIISQNDEVTDRQANSGALGPWI